MDVIVVCVSVGSSTVQLHDSLDSRRGCACSQTGYSSQNGDRVCGVYYRRAAFSCAFHLWKKYLNANNIYKETFLFYGGKCLSRKAVHNWIEKFSERHSLKSQMMPYQAMKSETTAKRLLRCVF
jgi:hypothetical protein